MTWRYCQQVVIPGSNTIWIPAERMSIYSSSYRRISHDLIEMSSVINKVDKELEKQRIKSYILKSESCKNFGGLWTLHILLLLPFWHRSLVVWGVFLLSPWSKESLHGENDSSNLSTSCTDSVPFPELWSRHDLLLLLPQAFVTFKDIIFLAKDKNITAF